MYPHRGEIWLVKMDPSVGAEIRKTRPALVISNDANNQYARTITVLPITDIGQEVYPYQVYLPKETKGLIKESKVKCEQIATVDKSRFIKLLGNIDHTLLLETEKAIKLHLAITD